MIKSFSLIEIMVTIAIVAILVGFAIPVYNKYVNNAKITQAAEVLQTLNNNAASAYNESSLGSTFLFNNVTLSNTVTAFAYPPVLRASYLSPTQLGSPNEWAFCVYVTGLNFSGYVDPALGGNGTYSRLCSEVVVTSGVFTTTCGAWDGTSADIPTKYLPSGCSCASVSTGSC